MNATGRIRSPYEWTMSSLAAAIVFIGLTAFFFMRDAGQADLRSVILAAVGIGLPACWAGSSLARSCRLRSAGLEDEASSEVKEAVVWGLMTAVGGLFFFLNVLR